MVQIFNDVCGHTVYVTYYDDTNAQGEVMGKRWAHGYCDECRCHVAAPADESQSDLFFKAEE